MKVNIALLKGSIRDSFQKLIHKQQSDETAGTVILTSEKTYDSRKWHLSYTTTVTIKSCIAAQCKHCSQGYPAAKA